MSTSAIHELPSGAPRIVASPRTANVHPAGAVNALPVVVVFGVSAASVSLAAPGAGAGDGAGGGAGCAGSGFEGAGLGGDEQATASARIRGRMAADITTHTPRPAVWSLLTHEDARRQDRDLAVGAVAEPVGEPRGRRPRLRVVAVERDVHLVGVVRELEHPVPVL